jgi:hypothetical protein
VGRPRNRKNNGEAKGADVELKRKFYFHIYAKIVSKIISHFREICLRKYAKITQINAIFFVFSFLEKSQNLSATREKKIQFLSKYFMT